MEEWYNITSEEVISKLESRKSGLTGDEAKIRLEKNGHNKLNETKKTKFLTRFISQFKDFMIIILIIAAILSAFLAIKEGEPLIDAIIILIVVFLNAILGVMQESKAEKAIEALKEMSLPYIKVKREGKIRSINIEDIVIGDIVLVEAGDYIPADMRIIENHSLKVEEAALTGESIPAEKTSKKLTTGKRVSLGDRRNMLFSGTNVVYGRGEAIVVSVGMETQLGKIADTLSQMEAEETPLQKKMNEISKMLSIIVIFIAVVMFIIGIVEGREVIDIFMLAVALAVAAIPEGLAAVITITLAIGVQKMAKEKSIIRKLSAVEALGSTKVICSDKTGTLTQNKMTVTKVFVNNKLLDITGEIEEIKNENIDMFSKIFTLCNDSRFAEDQGYKVLLGDPTETALIDLATRLGIDKEEYEKLYERAEELPFDSKRKMMSTINKVDNKYMVCTKGAIESILNSSKYILLGGEIKELTNEIKANLLEENLKQSREALRVLGFAYKYLNDEVTIDNDLDIKSVETDLVFVGMTGMIDPPRPEVQNAVKECYEAGMIPVMITGDNIDTAITIAKELGILTEGKEALTGLDVDAMSDDELTRRVKNIRVYARVSPENKIRIVKAWKRNGEIVAMTGDGVNDAPALKGADIGIGMGITGTEVSKSVSSMVLADDDFSTIVVAVKEGRRIYTNIKNVIVYLLASNLAEVIIIFIATLFNRTIFWPIQILWINLVTDSIPAIALGFEKAAPDVMKEKPRKANEKFFNKFLTARIIVPAIIKAIIIFTLYISVDRIYGAAIAGAAAFILLANIELLFAFVCRSDRKTIFQIGLTSNMHMLLSFVFISILQVLVFANPLGRQLLRVPHMPKIIYIDIIALALVATLIFEVTKVILAKIYVKKT